MALCDGTVIRIAISAVTMVTRRFRINLVSMEMFAGEIITGWITAITVCGDVIVAAGAIRGERYQFVKSLVAGFGEIRQSSTKTTEEFFITGSGWRHGARSWWAFTCQSN